MRRYWAEPVALCASFRERRGADEPDARGAVAPHSPGLGEAVYEHEPEAAGLGQLGDVRLPLEARPPVAYLTAHTSRVGAQPQGDFTAGTRTAVHGRRCADLR